MQVFVSSVFKHSELTYHIVSFFFNFSLVSIKLIFLVALLITAVTSPDIFHLLQYLFLNQVAFLFLAEAVFLQIHSNCLSAACTIILHSQFHNDLIKIFVLFLHFLVMAAALFGLTSTDKGTHCLKYLVRAP
jgi:hypothetical protein